MILNNISKKKKSQNNKVKYENLNDLGKTSSNCDLKQLICFFGFISIVILDLCLFQLSSSIQNIIIWYLRIVVVIPIIIIALIIAKKSLKMIYSQIRNPPNVIINGPFRYSRHPIYLSAILLYLSLEIVTFSIIGLIYFMGIIGLYSYFAKFEEKHLISEFKERYINYMMQVPRWIGFPKKIYHNIDNNKKSFSKNIHLRDNHY